MPKANILGISIAYDVIGEGDKTACITTGGRFGRDTPGARELAEELAKSGYRTLIWDRAENAPQRFRRDPVSVGVFGGCIFGVSRSSAVLRSGVPKTIVFGGTGSSSQCFSFSPRTCMFWALGTWGGNRVETAIADQTGGSGRSCCRTLSIRERHTGWSGERQW